MAATGSGRYFKQREWGPPIQQAPDVAVALRCGERRAERKGQLSRREVESRTLTAVLDGMAEGIWVTDAQGTVVRHNDALRELLRAGSAPITGQRPLALLRDEGLSVILSESDLSHSKKLLDVVFPIDRGQVAPPRAP